MPNVLVLNCLENSGDGFKLGVLSGGDFFLMDLYGERREGWMVMAAITPGTVQLSVATVSASWPARRIHPCSMLDPCCMHRQCIVATCIDGAACHDVAQRQVQPFIMGRHTGTHSLTVRSSEFTSVTARTRKRSALHATVAWQHGMLLQMHCSHANRMPLGGDPQPIQERCNGAHCRSRAFYITCLLPTASRASLAFVLPT